MTNDTRENVGAGWQPLLEALEFHLNQYIPGYEITQIKEKFGGLRYYIRFPAGTSNETMSTVHHIIGFAENVSFLTCEECGRPGHSRRNGYWIRTMCDDCDESFVESRRALLQGE